MSNSKLSVHFTKLLSEIKETRCKQWPGVPQYSDRKQCKKPDRITTHFRYYKLCHCAIYLIVLLQCSQEANSEAIDQLFIGCLESYSGVPACQWTGEQKSKSISIKVKPSTKSTSCSCVETLVILQAKFHDVSSLLSVLKIAILMLVLKCP